MLLRSPLHPLRCAALAALAAATLTACGGGQDATPSADASTASDTPLIFVLGAPAPGGPSAEVLALTAQPTFHAAPVLLDEPADTDAQDPAASALLLPHMQAVPAGRAGIPTQRLSVDKLLAAQRARPLATSAADGTATPSASAAAVMTYTPAQIRAAYGLQPLPAAGASLTAAQAALLGAGQTIYIVDAFHNPNAAAELAAFNQKFGLPACTTKAVAPNSVLPLAAASKTTCELSVVYSTATGGMTATAPAYDAGWATEIALDVQWAHATAPLARIVLIEAPDASLNSLLAAVRLANAMGPGVVSMSFGAPEGNYTASVDSAFTAPNMTYLAATGDWGAGVSWPSVSTNVLAVGGTSLNYSGSGARGEVAWSGTGGGVSAYTATPAYQSAAVPGFGGYARRAVADVAFNADPSTGQYTAVISPGSSTVNWMSVGGTSLSTPQWAGLVAVANALRAQSAKGPLGAAHGLLYGQIGAVPGNYASAFGDVASGSHGACALCTAKAGYDQLTGLGTPNAGSLLSLLGATTTVTPPPVVAPVAPTVTSTTVGAKVGTALSYAVGVTAVNPVTYTLGGAPAGLVISSAGVISWPSPVTGSYNVTVTARDTKTGLSGQGVLTLQVVKPGPVITAAAMTGVAGKPLTGTISISAPASAWVSISITGAPFGMSFAVSGLNLTANWASPVMGSYVLKVSVTDSAGLSATASVPVTISAR